MNLQQLRFAATIAETGSFSKAAELCHATQPTLSNAIAQLEKELGGKLFARTTRSVALTAFGESMRGLIQAVLEAQEELTKAADAYHNPTLKLLRIGLSPLVDMPRLVKILEPFRRQHPEVSVFFKECLLDDLTERLSRERIDIAILPTRPLGPRFQTRAFYREPLMYLPRQDAHADRPITSPLRVAELPEAPIILTGGGCGMNDALRDLFKAEGRTLEAYPGHALSYGVIEEWSALGIGAGILPRAKLSGAQPAASLRLHDNRKAMISYDWVWDTQTPRKPHIEAFKHYIATTAIALLASEQGA